MMLRSRNAGSDVDFGSFFGWRVATENVGQVMRGLARPGGIVGRVGDRVGEQVVDGREAGGVRVAEIGDTDRYGLLGKQAQAMAGRVAGKVDQDVEPIAPDQFGNLFIIQAVDGSPALG